MKRCFMSFRIGSLILFSWVFLHTNAVWVFCECENAFFAGGFGAHGKLMDVQLRQR